MPRLRPERLREYLEQILDRIYRAKELSRNNDLSECLDESIGRLEMLILNLTNLLALQQEQLATAE